MDYTPFRLPPANWLTHRHCDLPALFRDTMVSSDFWFDEQRTAIKAALRGWRTDGHPYHSLKGTTAQASTRIAQVKREAEDEKHARQNHTFRYFIDKTRRRPDAATDGIIIYAIHIERQLSAAPFLRGPASLNCTAYDVWTHSTQGTNLTLIAGQQNTYTALHENAGSDSVWQLLVEGQKLWIVGRPEATEDMQKHLPSDKAIDWRRITEGVSGWMVDQRTYAIVQNAGDIVYLPRGWPHVVKHYTDTLAINSNLLHAWDFPKVLNRPDFTSLSEEDVDLYRMAMDAMRKHEHLQRMSRTRIVDLEQTWAVRIAEWTAADVERKTRAAVEAEVKKRKEEEEEGQGQPAKRMKEGGEVK